MAISLTQLGNVQHSIVNKYIGSFMLKHDPVIGSLLHHHFIYAKLEELYLVNSKKVLIVQFNSKTLKDTKVQN